MKHSLKSQLFASVFLITLILFGSNFLLNNFFLERYYVYQNERKLDYIYQMVNEVEDVTDYQEDDFDTRFQRISTNNNVDITILYPGVSGEFLAVYESKDDKIMRGRVEGYLFGFDISKDEKNILIQNDAYMIQKFHDSFLDNTYLECWGQLDNGCYFLMRIPLQSIKDSVVISNQFSAYVLLSCLILSLVMIWIISRKITTPIMELTALSEQMAKLDFSVKYTGKGSVEIEKLGENFNYLSETLETTISELKTANNELQSDLQNKIQIDEMRKEFLSNVSHELKTPIALIQGYAEGLLECINDDQESREFYCEVIIDEAGKMNKMVKSLLSLNQLESGNNMLQIQRFDLCEVLKGVAGSAKILAEQKEAEITTPDLTSPVYVWGDEFRIEEVVTNYISNALNHVSGKNQIVVTMEQKGQILRTTVFNTGSHIPEEDLENVWVKFFKVDKARTREYGGNGIGLSIVKAIMESHHQAYGVENREDGVAFWFELDCGNGEVKIEQSTGNDQ